jgi:hypothetical protein
MTREEITKVTSVVAKINEAHANLVSAVADIPDDVMTTRPVIDWWTLKDILGHVAMWERVAIKFIDEHQRIGAPTPLGLDDAGIDAYNKRGAAERRDYSLARVRTEFDTASNDLVAAVERLTEAQLNAPLAAPWDNDVTLERLIAWNSYEHVPEHVEQIARWRSKRAAQH